ncbi:Profilin [Aphelenchoides besseyi]|nr:Profilin [Aphelenchoides besseyi]KAI6209478.1 Profilin [Aphelenchoides besseyi]
MSWQGMVDDNLVGSGAVSKAAICGLDGSIWAKSNNFNLDGNETAQAAKGFNDSGSLFASGLRFEGNKYLVLQADSERIMGKKASDGCFCFKTGQAFVIGVYESGLRPEQCSKVCGDMADYLKSQGY